MRWTKQEIERLKNLYPTTFIPIIAKEFGRSRNATRMKANRIGLKAIKHFHKNNFAINPFKNISSPNLAYFAGIIDGEGTISIYIMKRGKYKDIRISFCNTNKALIDWAYQTFAGQITERKNRPINCKPIWRWELFNNIKVYHLLKLLCPFLIVKKEKAEEVLNIWDKHNK